MTTYRVVFSCNPKYPFRPDACSTRTVEVESWEDIPQACADARNFRGPLSDITINSLDRMK